MEVPYKFKIKVCKVGQQAVGKTSLIKRLVREYNDDIQFILKSMF